MLTKIFRLASISEIQSQVTYLLTNEKRIESVVNPILA